MQQFQKLLLKITNNMNKQILFPLFLFFMGFVHLHAQPPGAQFVWVNAKDTQRFQVVVFRYDLVLDATPESAQLHIFADSRYHLLINGAVLQFGPGRFYPAHPEFDTHDLRPYLRPGNNAIAVKVFSNGTSSFQLRRAPGAFIAWGEVYTAMGSKYTLHTPGNWKCLRLQGYDPQTPRMSFAHSLCAGSPALHALGRLARPAPGRKCRQSGSRDELALFWGKIAFSCLPDDRPDRRCR